MDDTTVKILIYVIMPLVLMVLSAVGFYVKNQIGRIDMLEAQIVKKVDETQVRQILVDKVDPLREDIAELKSKVDRIYDILIHKE